MIIKCNSKKNSYPTGLYFEQQRNTGNFDNSLCVQWSNFPITGFLQQFIIKSKRKNTGSQHCVTFISSTIPKISHVVTWALKKYKDYRAEMRPWGVMFTFLPQQSKFQKIWLRKFLCVYYICLYLFMYNLCHSLMICKQKFIQFLLFHVYIYALLKSYQQKG